ncbi:hypothetical protein [Actinopolymorpha alba]|uniref:hypothetical protein n=1 Tax=Actinopolymorpha alba TaxID=533267 RepID=UPI0003787626|nr:hypothetical protein [Actinopolymorpha alba]
MRLRAGLLFLTVTQVALGAWILVSPRSFYAIPVVNMRMPYNEHLLLDYGAMNLALAVVLGASLVLMTYALVRTALAAYLLFAVSHLVIHIRFLHHLSARDGVILMALLTTGVAIPIALLALTRRPQQDHRQESVSEPRSSK